MILIETWDEAAHGPLSMEAVKATLDQPTWYRVSEKRYPAGSTFGGTMRSGRLFVVQGRCRYQVEVGAETVLSPGDVAAIPAGDYDFTVEGDEDFEAVMVWKLPPEFRGE